MFKILIVEDDKELSLLFQKVLEKSGYQVKSASDGAQALEVLDREYIDLIISDIMMPVMDGYELVSELRSAGYQIPVLMITAKSSFDDVRQGFLSGSDDYMVKPVNVNEMVLRVGALLRRAQILNEHKIVIGSTELDYDAMTVVTGNETLVLPKKEFLLLYKLAASPGRTFTKQQLMDEVWGYETEADPHTIEVHIGRIRERFKENPDHTHLRNCNNAWYGIQGGEKIMEYKKKKELRIRSCLTGAIWLALAFSMLISALLFAFLNHFLDLPGKIPGLGWLLIFNTLIAGLITSFINARLLEPITRLSKAMKAVSQGDFEQHLETNSRIAEIGESYKSFNVMTKELRATEMLQMDFVSNVSHEFKTPINAIEGYTMLLQGDELSQEQEGYVEKILFNTQRLSGLVGNILLLSRLENQNIPMKKTKYRLDEQIRQAFLALEDKWTEKGIGFQVEMEEVRYVGNEGLFMHIWMNLLDNAIKFSPQNGTITMFLRHENDSVQFILEDEGPGIADDAKARIFDKFYQVDGSHKAEGNGLGLALVKRIVDIAGGTIKAENREYGGCRFVVELPIKNYNE